MFFCGVIAIIFTSNIETWDVKNQMANLSIVKLMVNRQKNVEKGFAKKKMAVTKGAVDNWCYLFGAM